MFTLSFALAWRGARVVRRGPESDCCITAEGSSSRKQQHQQHRHMRVMGIRVSGASERSVKREEKLSRCSASTRLATAEKCWRTLGGSGSNSGRGDRATSHGWRKARRGSRPCRHPHLQHAPPVWSPLASSTHTPTRGLSDQIRCRPHHRRCSCKYLLRTSS